MPLYGGSHRHRLRELDQSGQILRLPERSLTKAQEQPRQRQSGYGHTLVTQRLTVAGERCSTRALVCLSSLGRNRRVKGLTRWSSTGRGCHKPKSIPLGNRSSVSIRTDPTIPKTSVTPFATRVSTKACDSVIRVR